MKIRTKIYFISLSLILIVGLSTVLIVRNLATKAIKREITTRLTANTQSRARHIETVLDEYKNTTLTLATGNSFRDAVDMKIYFNQRIQQANRRIKSVIQSHKQISRIRILDKNGIIIASSHTDVGHDKSARDIFIKGKEKIYLEDLHISKFANDIVISASTPIFLNGIFSGLIIINFNTDRLFSITEDMTGLGKTGEIYLVNKDGYIITPSRFLEDVVLKKKIDIEKLKHDFTNIKQTSNQEHENIALSLKNYKGIDVLAVHSHIREMDWILLAEINKDEAFAPVDDLTNTILLIIATLLAFGVFLSFFVSNKITKPILKLYQGAEEISKGNLNYKIGIRTKDEIGQLSSMFDDMTSSLKKSQEKTEKHSRVLEKTVKARTKDLREKIEEIEQQNAVMANIASDLGDTNKNLKIEAEERKQAEKALRESEQKYKALFEASAEGILVADIETKLFKYANPAICRILGYNEKELNGMNVSDIHPKDALEHVVSEFEAQARGEKMLALNIPCLRKDGTTIYTNISTAKTIIDGRECNVGFFTDITERKKAEEALQESEEKHRRLTEAVTDMVFTIDKTGRFTYLNPEFEKITGFPADDYVGRSFTELLVPEYIESTFDNFKRGLAGEKIPLYEVELKHKSKERVSVELNVATLYDAQGNSIGRIGTARDITERKQAEEALRENEKRLKVILDTIQTGIALIDPETHIIRDVNIAAEEMIGASKDEIIGKICHSYICPAEKGKCPITDLGQEVDNSERVLLNAKGESVPVLKTVTTVMIGGKEYLLDSFVDISDRKLAEEKIKETTELLQSIMNSATEQIIIATDPKGIILSWNEGARKLLGYEAEEVIGKESIQIFHTEEYLKSGRMEPNIKKITATKEPHKEEIMYKAKDGRIFPALQTVNPRFDGNGEFIGMLGMAIDITDRKQAEDSVQESELRFRTLFEQSYDAIIVHNLKGEILDVNSRAAIILDKDINHIVDTILTKLLDEDNHSSLKKDYQENIKDSYCNFETYIGKADGNVTYLDISSRIVDKKQGIVQGIIRDITERKLAEEKIKQTMSELERFNKIAVGRELRMIELKKKINEFYQEKGEPPIYKTDFDKAESKNDLAKAKQ